MKSLILKLNHIFFWWYYRRVPVHFRQYRVLKSVDLLRQNYDHRGFVIEQNNDFTKWAIEREKQLMQELRSIRIQQIGQPNVVRKINDIFKTDVINGDEN